MDNNCKNVAVVILGDIGRSPRMQYHSLSLAEHGHKVDILAYKETRPIDKLETAPLVNFHYLLPYPNIPLPRIINYFFKTIWQSISLMVVLLIIRKADYVLVQNPPAIPSLIVCWIYSLVCKAKLIIDWHNYAHTIMSLSVGKQHPLVKLTKKIEEFFGNRSYANFCVTNAMKNDLMSWCNIKATTLYDRPPEIFRSISLSEKQKLFDDLGKKYKITLPDIDFTSAFTETNELGCITLKANRPGLLVSSTSWTEDEDFSMLLDALQDYETSYNENKALSLPKLVCIITGKGPLKEYYRNKIEKKMFKNVNIIMPWLEYEHYPLLLAAADLGVCLHKSSSGLDLPMKVVDMFGCGLPVCAVEFPCINELVVHGENGFTFKTTQELSTLLIDWFKNFPNNKQQQDLEKKFKFQLHSFQKLRWKENWNEIAYPIFK